ncbi:DUF2264 domain-containing protein [Paenibacillus sp. P96]|uniref:DUF2264 domain-containing protein n=1 Tax=Paenibacillus zeirhizosphaerae TaxID=2987519 RepID=A0ABT9FRL3_9BACL|nr:DUF2264 domain-containing protein [Paenibacillus sp. P96]MDP4097381.1 DUF2264 domain-containing protein [Paenibacillus sp. P96]
MTSYSAIADNPLITRQDLQLAFEQLAVPLKQFYSEGGARLRIGVAGASYDSATAEMEGFSRVMWGMVPLLAGGGESELWDTCLRGLENGTNPDHEEYWGDVRDYDQRLVEMAALGFALLLVPERVWEPMSDTARRNLYNWLNQINHYCLHDCNWLFFHVLVNMGFRKVGLPYDQEQMETNLRRIDDFYLSEGWYADGVGGHCDYYGPFALHYYGLLYACLTEREDPERAALYKERASLFASQFINWFAEDGAALPYGRSLTYRFAQSAFWSALAYAGVDAFPLGVLKGLVLRNLRWWFSKPIFDATGLLTVGYAYPNLIMAENYNSPASPYWALKAFLPLALSEDHPFWTAEELSLPSLPAVSVQPPAQLVLCRDQHTGHVAAFNTGHPGSNEHTHTSAKYEKFVYSTSFAFSVPRAEWGLSQGAFDSMLALSEGDNLYRVRRKNEVTNIRANVLYAKWQPWNDVEVRTWIVAGLPWHIRIHRIESARRLDAAEGGFALGIGEAVQVSANGLGAAAVSEHGGVAVRGKLGFELAELVYPDANTNLLHPRTVIPTLRASLQPGTHWLASAIYGRPGAGGLLTELEDACSVTIEENVIRVTTSEGEPIALSLI